MDMSRVATCGSLPAEAHAKAGGDSILVRIRPERWLSVDYGKQYTIEQ
jgi:hypothetical protein